MSTSDPSETDGQVVGGRYRLEVPIGRGGFGVVWRGQDTLLGRTVAVKQIQIPPQLSEEDRQHLQRKVLREARVAARLSHPSAVTVFDVIEEDGNPYIVMELIDALSLSELVEERGPLSPERSAGIGLELLDVLQAAHARGIIHRDIKPGNVLVPLAGLARLADFGIASIVDEPSMTNSGLVHGSPSYMSPEQAMGQQVGTPSDLWSLGATLYFAVEGEAPFDKGGPVPTMVAVCEGAPRPPERAGDLAPLLLRLMTRDPQKRATAQQAVEALHRVARPAPLPPRSGLPADETAELVLPGIAALDQTTRLPAVRGPIEVTSAEPAAPSPAGPPGPDPTPHAPVPSPGLHTPDPPRQSPDPPRQSPVPPRQSPVPPRQSPVPPLQSPVPPLQSPVPPLQSPVPPLQSPVPPLQGPVPPPQGPVPPPRTPDRPLESRIPPLRIPLPPLESPVPPLQAPPSIPPAPRRPPTSAVPQADPVPWQAPQGRTSPAGPGRRRGLLAGAVVGILLVAAIGLLVSLSRGGGPTTTPPPTPTASGASAASVPAGWVSYTDPATGFTISHPPGWRITRSGTRTDFTDPATGTYLRVDHVEPPGPSAVGAWQDEERSFAAGHTGYHRIQLQASTFQGFPAANWEFNYTEGSTLLHAFDLGFITGRYGFALYFQSQESRWQSLQPTFEAFKASFKAPA